ncbi:MAG: hypothetical protein K8R01_02660, partial [Methanococcoides sp.]|nr:hypothetical protein [Methanococcoides sp.]
VHPDDTWYLPDGIQKDPKRAGTQIKKKLNDFLLPFGPTERYKNKQETAGNLFPATEILAIPSNKYIDNQ